MAAYWDRRKEYLYYQVVRALAHGLSQDAKSIVDIGSAACPYLDWFPHVPERVSLDLHRPYEAPGIIPVTADFLSWEPGRRFDLVTCLQVLEHIPDATAFAQKLLLTGDIVVVSVPYRWKPGRARTHVQDPVDEKKMRAWFGRDPNFEYVCREVTLNADRLIQVYEPSPGKWRHLKERRSLIAAGAADPAPQAVPEERVARIGDAKLGAVRRRKPTKAARQAGTAPSLFRRVLARLGRRR